MPKRYVRKIKIRLPESTLQGLWKSWTPKRVHTRERTATAHTQTGRGMGDQKPQDEHSRAQGNLAQATRNNRKNEKALRRKNKTCWRQRGLYRRLPEPGEALGKRAGRGRGKRHTEAVKRGGPQGSAANATVLIPPLGNAQLGEGEGTQENATRECRGLVVMLV